VRVKNPPAKVIEINREPSALRDQVTDILFLGSASEIMKRLIDRLEEELSPKTNG